MSKIKLLILLLISFSLLSCSINSKQRGKISFSIDYIDGGYQGVLLKNTLQSYLISAGMYDKYSRLEIRSSIGHSEDIFITNIDNTSDRYRISSTLINKVYDNINNCIVYQHSERVSQFYVFASNSKFISNSTAAEKIRFNNINELIKLFINDLQNKELKCIKDE
jgi:hypothetical protein